MLAALAFCRMEGFSPRVSFRSAQIETVRAFVAAGWGVSVVPAMACPAKTNAVAAPEGDAEAVLYRPLGDMRRTIGFILNEQRSPSRATTALMEFLKRPS